MLGRVVMGFRYRSVDFFKSIRLGSGSLNEDTFLSVMVRLGVLAKGRSDGGIGWVVVAFAGIEVERRRHASDVRKEEDRE